MLTHFLTGCRYWHFPSTVMVEEVNVCREVISGIKADVKFGRLPKIGPGRIPKKNAVGTMYTFPLWWSPKLLQVREILAEQSWKTNTGATWTFWGKPPYYWLTNWRSVGNLCNEKRKFQFCCPRGKGAPYPLIQVCLGHDQLAPADLSQVYNPHGL